MIMGPSRLAICNSALLVNSVFMALCFVKETLQLFMIRGHF